MLGRIFDIRDYGATTDGLNTTAIQKAIDDCNASGGGTVLISGGTYKTGSIELKSNVELHIATDGVLLGSENCEDFPERENLKHVIRENLPRVQSASIIFAEECENISITGMGKIDCNGHNFVVEAEEGYWMPYKRIDAPTPPRAVFFTGCRNVRVENITMVNQPAGWSYWIHDCDYVTFSKIKIIAELDYPNNDGIHINSSRNVNVSDCDISCGDDCIVVRANNRSLKENKVCEKVTVTNCNLTSHASGIRIGWINDGVMRNCTFSNIVMTDCTRAVTITMPPFWEGSTDYGREATLIENMTFNNIIADNGYTAPIIMYIGVKGTRCEAVRNIYFNNFHARGFQLPYIFGRPDCKIKNVYFNNCTFEKLPLSERDNKNHGAALPHIDNADFTSVYVRNAENVVFNNTAFTISE